MRTIGHFRLVPFVLVSLFVMGCSTKKEVGSVKDFAQKGPQSVVELNDKEGHSWQIDTVETAKATTYFVIDSAGKVILTAARFDGHNRRQNQGC